MVRIENVNSLSVSKKLRYVCIRLYSYLQVLTILIVILEFLLTDDFVVYGQISSDVWRGYEKS